MTSDQKVEAIRHWYPVIEAATTPTAKQLHINTVFGMLHAWTIDFTIRPEMVGTLKEELNQLEKGV